MLHFFIIADKERCLNEAGCWINSIYDCCSKTQNWQICSQTIPRFSLGSDRLGYVRDAYHKISDKIEQIIKNASPSDRFVGVIDVRNVSSLGEISSLQSVQGLLILSFPEILWVPDFKDNFDKTKENIAQACQMVENGYTPLFDGTGIRSELIGKRETNSVYQYTRNDIAISIDEEKYFAKLTAYTAFRFGYRAYPVSLARLADQVLKNDKIEEIPVAGGISPKPNASLIIFEDGDIEFPDLTKEDNEEHHLGDRRDNTWPLLKNANLRVLATAYNAGEKIATETVHKSGSLSNETVNQKITVQEWFGKENIKNLVSGINYLFVIYEYLYRRLFNIFAGGLGDVWIWNICKGIFIFGIFVCILIRWPFLFVPALFLVFVVFGLLRKNIVKFMLFLFGHRTRIRTFFKIRSHWRFYPKKYFDHFPQYQIFQKNAHYWKLVQKPLGGIFGLRNQCGLPNGRGFNGPLNSQKVSKIYRNAFKGLAPTETGNDVEDEGHSAYGMTLDVATILIERAREIKDRCKNFEDAIHAAVLATCAYELLGHKTPTLSIEALRLRHYCEVLAECEFPGIKAQLDMEDRLVDIHNSMWQICRGPNGEVREEMFESGMAAICDSLSDLLRERGRNEEAAFMSRQSRYMHRLLLNPLLRNLLAFPEWAIRGKLNFILSLSLFLLLFFGYYHFIIDPNAKFGFVSSKMYEMLFSTQPDMGLNDIMCNAWGTNNIPNLLNQKLEFKEAVQLATTEVQAMRQVALIHLAFLAALFYDFVHRK